jgi:hypothetical protein
MSWINAPSPHENLNVFEPGFYFFTLEEGRREFALTLFFLLGGQGVIHLPFFMVIEGGSSDQNIEIQVFRPQNLDPNTFFI